VCNNLQIRFGVTLFSTLLGQVLLLENNSLQSDSLD